ncbi:hypothetical protein MKW92_033440, partial [Papaver armeniacum]
DTNEKSNCAQDRLGKHGRPDFGKSIDLNISLNVDCSEDVQLIHSRMPEEIIPLLGMEFETEEEAYNFYNNYAFNYGFSVRKSKAHRYSDGKVGDRILVCSAEGKRGTDRRDACIKPI